MRYGAARFSDRFLFLVAFISFVVLFASAVALVKTQYRIRLLFIEVERANDAARRLADDSNQLSLDLSRAALPAAVSGQAALNGFAPADISNTVLIEVDPGEISRSRMEVRK